MKMKVKHEIVNIDSRSIQTNKTNINSTTGRFESQIQEMNVMLELFTNNCKNIIIGVLKNTKTVSEGDFGSYTFDYSSEGILYIAKSDSDYISALKSFRNGIVPKGCFVGELLSNFDEDTYCRNNDFPFTISVGTTKDHIISNLESNFITLDFVFHDDFEFTDGLLAYMTEHNCSYGLPISNFGILFKNTKQRINYLWNAMSIDENFKCKGYNDPEGSPDIIDQFSENEDLTFGEVIIRAIKSLEIKCNKSSISKLIEINKQKVIDHNNLEQWKKERAEESNAKWAERNKGERFLTEKEKKTITVNSLSDINNNHNTNKNLVSDIHDIYYTSFRTNCNINDYNDIITNLIIPKLTNPDDEVDVDFAFQSIKTICDSRQNSKFKTIGVNNPKNFTIALANDLGFGYNDNDISKILKLPVKTFINLFNYISN